MKKYCTRCGKPFDATGREVICPSCKVQAAEETKRAAVLRAKRASWTGESVPVRISGRASTVIRAYGKHYNLPFAQALDALLQASDYVKGVGCQWDDIAPYKSRRRDKHTTGDAQDAPQASKPQDAPQASKPQDAPQASKPQDAPQASKPQDAPQASKPQDAPQASKPQDKAQDAQDKAQDVPQDVAKAAKAASKASASKASASKASASKASKASKAAASKSSKASKSASVK